MGDELKHSPLEPEHERLSAKMVPFAGWRMPLEYSGVLREHRAVRESVGLFDLSHLGKVEVRGPGALRLLQRALTNDIAGIEIGAAQYNLVLTDEGGIVDDLIVYRSGADEYLAVPNAANTDAVLAVLEGADGDAEVRHRADLATIAVQGPRSTDVVTASFPEAADLAFMRCAWAGDGATRTLVARSGYTGERGYELFVPAAEAPATWRRLEGEGADGPVPCGLGARDTLRLEMGYPLHGNDISTVRTPLEAGLSWAVAFDKGGFTGRDALVRLRERGPSSRLRGLRMEGRLIPRPGYAVFAGDRAVGETTSGTFSPTLRVGVALAYLDADVEPGERVTVDVRGRRGDAEVVKPPFVDSTPR